MRGKLVLAACAALIAGPAPAAESFYGRWAVDPAACAAGGTVMAPLQVTPLALQWPDTVCRVQRSYRVGDSWHIGARCPDVASDVAVTLQLQGERLRVVRRGLPLHRHNVVSFRKLV